MSEAVVAFSCFFGVLSGKVPRVLAGIVEPSIRTDHQFSNAFYTVVRAEEELNISDPDDLIHLLIELTNKLKDRIHQRFSNCGS